MGILWFGKAKTLEDLKEKDLKKERLVQEVQQDQLVTRMKNAQGEYEARLAAASEPGLMDAEIEIAAYKMDQAEKRKVKAESDLQHVLTRMSVLDSTLDLLQQRAELEKKGVWKTINSMDEDALQAQLEDFAADRKGSRLNVNRIAEMLTIDPLDVKASQSPGVLSAKAAIEAARAAKSG